MPLLTEGRVTEGSANKRSKQYRSYGSSPGKKGVKENTKSSHSDNSIIYIAESISPQPSVSSVLPQANPVPGYAIDVIMGPLHDPPLRCTGIYPSFDLFAACASRRTYVPFRSPAAVVSSTHFLPSRQQPVAQYVYSEYTSTSRRNDPSHTGHGSTNLPAPPYGYPPQPLPVGHPPSVSTAPTALHKHWGNGETSGGQEKGEIT